MTRATARVKSLVFTSIISTTLDPAGENKIRYTLRQAPRLTCLEFRHGLERYKRH